MTITGKQVKIESVAPKRRRLRVGDPDFVPPDGGWGWLIVLACGFSNLSIFPMFQQFGLVFRDKFEGLGISNTQTTTVINVNQAFNSCIGLFNGPIYRQFSYRQVAIFGSCLVAISLTISTFCGEVWSYLIFYSMCYGSGIGITQTANSVALNTFFKDKRRIATGFSWSTTALGPIVWPYIITALIDIYGTDGTLLIFSAFALHSLLFSLLLQPVEWHTKFRDEVIEDGFHKIEKKENKSSLLSSQYLHNEDDPKSAGYEVIDPGHPMMLRANDGWYSQIHSLAGSRSSLASRFTSGQNSVVMSKRPSYKNLSEALSKKNSSVNLVQDSKERKSARKPAIQEEEENHENCTLLVPEYHEKDVLKTAAKKLEEYKQEFEPQKLSFFQKFCIFFDFDLFKDPVYVTLMLGITFANFVEINFSIITPMVLQEFQFGKYEIATFMSLLGATDIVVRFCIPFISEKIGWDNRTFFLVGVLAMAFGRISMYVYEVIFYNSVAVLVHTQTFLWGLVVAVIIGAGKGLRTIFIALVIPGYVPLERLPAASGLQLATSGLFFLILGPGIGWVRDQVQSYVITLHLLNLMTYGTAIAWTLEAYLRKKKVINEQSAL